MLTKSQVISAIQKSLISFKTNVLDRIYAKSSDVLTKTNNTVYTPSASYNPATKKYVDDSINTALNAETTSTSYGKYTIQYNETEDSLDFIYKG